METNGLKAIPPEGSLRYGRRRPSSNASRIWTKRNRLASPFVSRRGTNKSTNQQQVNRPAPARRREHEGMSLTGVRAVMIHIPHSQLDWSGEAYTRSRKSEQRGRLEATNHS
ncbi:hypothetical protein TESG_08308 [Trichophyton tonsurans CBS 112818]|uniref:Uncharacterized protein n=1 Tax=Trichophyton tonsurans (strain CBS 112818) TaxID=647933 RepID=F2RRR5_TRIT1|nr:hypothetical protein TESG_08308 [Trichophyton tonsurans CBS 112818]